MMAITWRNLFEAIKQQRLGIASAATAAAVLITFFHAPLVPVIAGCFLALVYLVVKSFWKSVPR